MNKYKGKIMHVSYAKSFEDGGIYTSVKKIIDSQELGNLNSRWISTKNIKFNNLLLEINRFNPSFIHIHGLWRLPTRAKFVNNLKKPFIISPHGMLSDWALKQSFFKKKLALKFWEMNSLRKTKIIHALSNKEIEQIKSILPEKNIALIPNCVDNKYKILENYSKYDLLKKTGLKEFGICPDDKILLYLGRFHKGKNVDLIIKSWIEIRDVVKKNKWHLCLVGEGNEKSKIIELSKNFPFKEYNWHLSKPLFDAEKYSAFYAANGFILSSDSEAMPMATLEAMSTGLTCLISKETNLDLELSLNLAIKTQPNKEDIINSIKKLIYLNPDNKKQLSKNLKSHINKYYSKNRISDKYLELYEWLYFDHKKPDFIF